MTTETILTNQEISDIWLSIIKEWGLTPQQFEQVLQFARAIEKAVLNLLPVQTSSTIRGDSYAGVYVWFGNENLVQHIPKVLAQTANDPQSMLGSVAAKCIQELKRFSELQSPEVQAWKRDAERYRYIRLKMSASNVDYLGRPMRQFHFDRLPDPLNNPLKGSVGGHLDDAIDAAMEQQTCEKISQGAYS